MVTLARAVIAYIRALFVPRHKLALEAAALRQQLAVLKRKQPRPKLHRLDRVFWIALRQLVVWLGRGPDHCETRNRRVLASGRIPVVLAVAVEVLPIGTTEGEPRDSPVDLHSGGSGASFSRGRPPRLARQKGRGPCPSPA